MNFVNTNITSSDVNAFFSENFTPLGSVTLESTLRFIALKHHQGDIETIKPIKLDTTQRYADDIILSSDMSFNWGDIQSKILDIVGSKFQAPFSLNTSKTRYGSSAGRNWNLGVMLNSDNQITIGHSKKKVFKAMLFSFMNDDKNGNSWSLEDVQHLQGLISYYKMVEGATIDTIIKSYSEKFNKNVEQTIKEVLRVG